MKTATIDNSDAGYIERVILWQYDNAEHLKDLILNLKGFYDKYTKDHFDEIVERMNLADENIDDYGLAVWGKILNTNRPNLTYIDEKTSKEVTRALSNGVYRKILIGKIKLFEGSATLKEFAEYIKSIFSDGVICTDGPDTTPPDASSPDMSLRFIKNPDSTIWSGSDAPELDALISQAPEIVFVYPAGVRSSKHSTSNMFCLAEHNAGDVVDDVELTSATGQPTETEFNVGGLDNSGFNWRLTTKGNWR